MTNSRVILTTLAGRRDRMEILLEYVLFLLKRNTISEYHIWDYAFSENDREWIASLPALSDKIELHWGGSERFDNYYDYYTAEEFGDAAFIKVDDDIVFVDVDRLAGFIEHRRNHPEIFLLSANIINNGVCAYYQQQQGVIPQELMRLQYPDNGFCGELWESSSLAEKLHLYFLANRKKFSYPGIQFAPDRLSINFISYLGSDLLHIKGIRGDDEHALSLAIPASLDRKNYIYNQLTVSHLSFYSQESGLNHAMLLREYSALQKNLCR
ncbi:hypothetical protein ACFL17_05455 [Pseudomonadota bacterium]